MTGEAERWRLPVWWWGPLRSDRSRFTIEDLVSQKVLDQPSADQLTRLVAQGASTIACAMPSGAGKTTLLTSLLPFVSASRVPYFVRGMFDPLSGLDAVDPQRQVLLVNEISPHLPIYLWGASVCRVVDRALRGAQLLATAHAESPASFIHQLMAYPTNASVAQLRVWDLVIFLDAWRDGAVIHRQIASVVSLSGEAEQGIAVDRLATRESRIAGLEWDDALAADLGARLRQRSP